MTLYKYLSETRLDVLRDRRVRFTQAAALNDPFELNPYFDSLVSDSELLDHIVATPLDIAPHLREAYDKLSQEAQAAMSFDTLVQFAQRLLESPEGKQMFWATIGEALGMIREITPGIRSQLLDTLRTKIGLLSLSAIPNDPLMWAHYASQHRGFVVGFDSAHPFFNQRRSDQDECFHLRMVDYRPAKSFSGLTDMDGSQILCAKTPDWSYEHEWRMLIPVSMVTETLGDEAEPIHLVAYPPSAVECVILGSRISQALETELKGILSHPDYAHVQLFGARPDAPSAAIVIEPIPSRQLNSRVDG